MTTDLSRAKRLVEARRAAPETAGRIEDSIASELLSPETTTRDRHVRPLCYPQYAYLSPMAATEAFAAELQQALTRLAETLDAKVPKGAYSPLVATPRTFRNVWRARQVVDELGIPYGFYVEYAVLRWHELGNKRIPRPLQLTTPEMAMHVMALWADPAFRSNYVLAPSVWDERFSAGSYSGDLPQNRALDLIEQRILDAKSLGHDPVAALAVHIDVDIAEEEAVRRFGAHMVDKANELVAVAAAEGVALSALDDESQIAQILADF